MARVPIQVGHSADPDDAFMVWALEAGAGRHARPRPGAGRVGHPDAERVGARGAARGDRALRRRLSGGRRPLRRCCTHGASFGEGYGPIVVARSELSLAALRELEIVDSRPADDRVPGCCGSRSATGCARATCRSTTSSTRSTSGRAEAGLLIHEGQLTYADAGSAQGARPRRVVAGGDRACRCRSASSRSVATSSRLDDVSRRPARVDRGRAREPRRGDRLRDDVRPRDRRRDRRPVRRDVRQRLTLDMGARGGPRRDLRGVLGARAGVRRRERRAVVLSAVRTPVGRYGGGLAGRPPRRPGGARDARGGRPRRRAGGRRSRTSGSAARTRRARTTATSRGWPCCSPACPSRSAASPSTGSARPGLAAIVGACHAVIARRRRPVRRRRRRVDDARAARHGEAGRGVPARRPARCTTRRSAGASRTRGWRSSSRSRRWARPARTSPSAGTSRARMQDAFALRSQQRWAAAAEAGPVRRRARPGRRPRRATSIRAPTRRRRSSRR